MLISVGDAAKVLGLKSRGSIYRKIERNELETVPGPDGKPLIERNDLERRWAAITRKRTDSPQPLRPVAERAKSNQKQPPESTSRESTREAVEIPDYNDSRARSEYEKANLLELERKTKEEKLAYIEDMEIAYNAVLLQLTTKAGSLHKQIKADIPHLTHRELEKIERRISDIFESVASHGFEDLPE